MYDIMLIDDEKRKKRYVDGIIELLKENHGPDSVSLTRFTDGKSGLENLIPGDFGLILLDYFLDKPGKPLGTSLIPKIREIDSNVKIWMYTSSIDLEKAKKAGADDLLDPTDTNCFDKLYDYIEQHIK